MSHFKTMDSNEFFVVLITFAQYQMWIILHKNIVNYYNLLMAVCRYDFVSLRLSPFLHNSDNLQYLCSWFITLHISIDSIRVLVINFFNNLNILTIKGDDILTIICYVVCFVYLTQFKSVHHLILTVCS